MIDLAPFEDDMTDSLVIIANMENLVAVQKNIDWITQQRDEGKVPIAAALVLGDLLELFEAVAAKLQATE